MREFKIKLVPILIYFSLFFFSCQKNIPLIPELQKADQVMDQFPDSALFYLQQIPSPEQLPESQQAFYYLLQTQAMDKTYATFTSDSLISIVANYYESQKDPSLKARSWYYMGRVDYELGKYGKAVDYYLKAMSYAEEAKQYKLLALIYNHAGTLYRRQRMYDKALWAARQSCVYFEEVKDSSNMIYGIRDIGKAYSFMNEMDSSLVYYKQALALAEKLNNKRLQASVLNDIGLVYEKKGDYREAIEAIGRCGAIERSIGSSRNKLTNNLSLGCAYYGLNKMDSAQYYLQEALSSKNIYTQAAAYDYLYRISQKLKDYEKAVQYMDVYLQLRDSIGQNVNTEAIFEKMYEYRQLELQKDLELKHVRERFFLYGCISVVLIVFVGFFVLYVRNLWMKERLLRIRDKQIQLEKEQRLLSEKQIEQNKLQIEANQRKLNNKDEVLQSLQRDLLDYNNRLLVAENEIIMLKREELAFKNEVFRQTGWPDRIHSAGPESPDFLRRKDYINLAENLCLIYEDFPHRLQKAYPKLKEQELQICYLLKAGARTGNISSLVLMTPNAVSRKKKQILEKMEIFDENVSLELFLEAF